MTRDRGLAVIAFLILMAPFSRTFVRVHRALRGQRSRFLRVPIDVMRATGYGHAIVSITVGRRTRQLRSILLRAR